MMHHHHIFLKYIFILLLCAPQTIHTTDNFYTSYITQKNCAFFILGTLTALAIKKISQALQQNYFTTDALTIKNCKQYYKTVHAIIEKHATTYHHDAQLSDWQLKESICSQYKTRYPFMKYYCTLVQSSYALQQHKNNLKKKIASLKAAITTIKSTNTTSAKKHTLAQLIQLKQQGFSLSLSLNTMHSTLLVLKSRVLLLKEYKDDHHNWLYAYKKKELLFYEQPL